MARRRRALELTGCVLLALLIALAVGLVTSGADDVPVLTTTSTTPTTPATPTTPTTPSTPAGSPSAPTATAPEASGDQADQDGQGDQALRAARISPLPGIADAVTLFPKPPKATLVTPEFGPDLETPPSAEFTISSFNVLGSSHTVRGSRGWMASGPTRAVWAARIIAAHGASVVGFQELQPDQLRTLDRVTNLDFHPGLAHGARAAENAVGWRNDTWQLVSATTVDIPYFGGRIRPMPVVRLRHRATGLEIMVANFHNPASTARWGDNSRWRREATRRQVDLANRLVADPGLPVLFTGDFNERAEYFCELTAAAAMHASNGGSNDGACRPPTPTGIDWIFGSDAVEFLAHVTDRGPLVRRTTDHPVVVSRVRVGALNAGGLDAAAQDALDALREGHG